MKPFVFERHLIPDKWGMLGGLLLLVAVLVGCEQATPEQLPRPLLVTMPAMTIPPQTPTPGSGTPTMTGVPLEATLSPTPAQSMRGLDSAHLLWEWGESTRPSALAATNNRLAAIAADGRFLWITAETGKLEGSAYLWSGILQGNTVGEVYTDGIVALVAAVREMGIDAETGLAESRARLAVFDTQANEKWSLPQLESRHYYSAAIAPGPGWVVVGKWPHGFKDNELALYEMPTGKRLWRVKAGETGYQEIVHNGSRMYVLLADAQGGNAVGCYDLRTGDELWRWSDPGLKQIDRIALGGDGVYAMTSTQVLALDTTTGEVKWAIGFSAAAEAGMQTLGSLLYMAPAPSAQTGFRPGVVGLDAYTGHMSWNALGGLLADPLAASGEALWVIVKDFDTGQVFLSAIEPGTGLERSRMLVGTGPETIYRLVALDRRVYVLGKSLQAYGY